MKGLRHAKIREIVEQNIIETQEELAEALNRQGIKVTQATVSRDIKELMLLKVPKGDGQYRYAFPAEAQVNFSQSRMARNFQDSVINIDSSQNIIVLRTIPGAAQSVASTIDYLKWPEILGTVAGDDTIFVLIKSAEAMQAVIGKFQALQQQ